MFARSTRIALAIATIVAALATVDHHAAAAGGDRCAVASTAQQLDQAIASRSTGVVGADYQRTIQLPDGRVLWLFQDAFISTPRGTPTLVHNAALVQRGG